MKTSAQTLASNIGNDRTEWSTVKFGDIVRNVDEVERDPIDAGLERYIGLDHLDPESLHIRRWGLIADGTSFTRRFRPGQVLFGKRRAYQRKVAVAAWDGICSGDILVFEPKNDRLLPELLPFVVQSEGFFDHAIGTSAGSLSPRTRWRDLAEYEFSLPPKPEQQRIAEILWAADEAVQRLVNVSSETTTLTTLARESFVCDPQFSRSEVEDCLCAIIAGKSAVGVDESALENEYGVLKVSAVGPLGFDANENKRLLDPQDFIPRFQVQTGDLLITRANTRELVGRVCIVPRDFPNLMLCDKTLRLEIDPTVALTAFIHEVLRTRELRSQIEAIAGGTGGAMKNISQSGIRSLRIPLPDLCDQARVMRVMSMLDEASNKIECEVVNTKSLLSQLREFYFLNG